MCALSADEILLASGAAGLRAVSLYTAQLAAYEPNAIRDVYDVAFDAHTDTLLLLVWEATGNNFQLVSLRRNASEWLEVQRLDTFLNTRAIDMVVCDSRVLLRGGGGNTLYVLDVSGEHTLCDAGNVSLQSKFYGVACIHRDGVTLVAISQDTSVFLLRLTLLPLRLVPLASASLTDPYHLLFREDLLIVTDWNSFTVSHAIVSFRVSDNALSEPLVLLDAQDGVDVRAWALASDRLVLWNGHSEELRVYAFT